MPKKIDTLALIKELGGPDIWEYNHSAGKLWCLLCSQGFDKGRKSHMENHVKSERHKARLPTSTANSSAATLRQSFIGASFQKTPSFAKDLCTMLVKCNIPLFKVEKAEFVSFLIYRAHTVYYTVVFFF